MEQWIRLLLPFGLLLARISAFFAVLPIFGWRMLPMRVRAGIALVVTVFFAMIMAPKVPVAEVHWMQAVVMMAREALCGLALGLVACLVFMAAQQGGRMASRQMGFADAGIIDPVSGERTQPIGMFFEMTFALFFLACGAHHLLLLAIARSYEVFPIGSQPSVSALTGAVVNAGSTMLIFALKLAAPLLAGFLIMAVVLALLARVLPEMNILLASLPLRVGVGLFMAAAVMPLLSTFTSELSEWMNRSMFG